MQLEVLVKADDGRDLVQQLAQALLLKPGKRLDLRLDEIGGLHDQWDTCIRLASGAARRNICERAYSSQDCHKLCVSL